MDAAVGDLEGGRAGDQVEADKNGRVDAGVRDGSAAWLELDTHVGRVHNDLSSADAPDAADPVDKRELRASTKLGDVVVRRVTNLEKQP